MEYHVKRLHVFTPDYFTSVPQNLLNVVVDGFSAANMTLVNSGSCVPVHEVGLYMHSAVGGGGGVAMRWVYTQWGGKW